MNWAQPTRRSVLLGGFALGTMTVRGLTSDRISHVGLSSETVALRGDGTRVLVPAGQARLLVPASRVLGGQPDTESCLRNEWSWLGDCAPWTHATSTWSDVLRSALLDLRVLSAGLPAAVAGWSPNWRYVWPRDLAHVCVALMTAGREQAAMAQLEFLASMQRADGWFDARVDPVTRRPPDDRAPQLDGLGWALWAAGHLPADRDLSPIRDLLVRSVRTLVVSLDPRTAVPPISPDYWEVPETQLTLGTVAPVLAGLQAAEHLLPRVGADRLATSAAESAGRLGEAVHRMFGEAGYPRHLGGHQRDAAVTFLVPPYSLDPPRPRVLTALDAARRELRRPAGGLAPGAEWRRDGISWTPETTLFALAYATTGQRHQAEALLRWVAAYRTAAGSFPEKVLYDGSPASVAPLAWTAALVVLTVAALSGVVLPGGRHGAMRLLDLA